MVSEIVEVPDFDGGSFDSKRYNQTYYGEVMQDEAFLVQWQAGPLDSVIRAHLRKLGVSEFGSQFDAGSGPTVHHLFALEKYSREIHLADYLPQNLSEIRGWASRTDPDAHDWNPFIRAILAAEGLSVEEDAIAVRESAVRHKIVSYNPLDLKEPVDEDLSYSAPFVTSFFVADSATSDTDTFVDMTRNAFKILETDGLFVAAYLGGCTEYMVGDSWFPSANITQADVETALTAAGAKRARIWRFDTPMMADDGFDHIFAATAELA